MSNQKTVLDLNGLTVDSVEVIAADSLDSATYGHGMSEFAASCPPGLCSVPGGSHYIPDEWDWADV